MTTDDLRRPARRPGLPVLGAVPAPRSPWERPYWSAARSPLPGSQGLAFAPDADLVARAGRDPRAVAAIYQRYADPLHDFCVGMLRDRDAAADCVQDVFTIAATKLGTLREGDKLRSWLYAIARHEALRRIRARRREQPTADVPDSPRRDDTGPIAVAARHELADLIAAAAGGLSERDRTLLELHYRAGLDGRELADALGVSLTHANTLVGRLRTTVERCLGALLLARRPTQPCADLATVLHGWDGKLTVLMRKRIARHVDGCLACDTQRRAMVNSRALLGSAPAIVPAPAWLHARLVAQTPMSTPPAGTGATWWPTGREGSLGHLLPGHALSLTPAAGAGLAATAAVVVAAPIAAVIMFSGTVAPQATLGPVPAAAPSVPRFAVDTPSRPASPPPSSHRRGPYPAAPPPPAPAPGQARDPFHPAPAPQPARPPAAPGSPTPLIVPADPTASPEPSPEKRHGEADKSDRSPTPTPPKSGG